MNELYEPEIELKPCPFCGGEVKMVHEPFTFTDIYYAVRCHKCKIEAFRESVRYLPEIRPEEAKAAQEKVARRWNTRSDRVNGGGEDNDV